MIEYKLSLLKSSHCEIIRNRQPSSASLGSPFKVEKLFGNDSTAFSGDGPSVHYRLSSVGICKLRICWKIWSWAPFSQAKIILDEDIWMFSPFQFYFQFIFGYELKTACCSSKITKASVAIQADCWKDVNKIVGPSWT